MIEDLLKKTPVSDFTPQPLNKCCISCGGYTMNLGEDYYPHTEHSRKFCFMCLFGGKADISEPVTNCHGLQKEVK